MASLLWFELAGDMLEEVQEVTVDKEDDDRTSDEEPMDSEEETDTED